MFPRWPAACRNWENQTSACDHSPLSSKTGDFTERVVPAAMGVTAEVIQRLEFAEDGDVDGSAESLLEFVQSGDFISQQKRAQSIGAEGCWSHNVIVPTGTDPPFGTITNLGRSRPPDLNVREQPDFTASRADLVCCRSPR